MKKTFISLFVIVAGIALFTSTCFAQVPQAFNYQAVARNSSGDIIANHAVGVKIILHQGSATGSIVYTETFAPTTNQFGLFTIAIGQGTPVSGTFNTVNWSSGNYWVQVQADATGGTTYSDMGATQLLTVPYAMYATKAGSNDSAYTAGNGISINGKIITNTQPNLNQTLSLKGDTLSISNGNQVILPSNSNTGSATIPLRQLTETGYSMTSYSMNCMTSTTNGQILIVALTDYTSNSRSGLLRMEKDQNGYYHATHFIAPGTGSGTFGRIFSMTIIKNFIYLNCYVNPTYSIKRVKLADLDSLTAMTLNPTTPSNMSTLSTDNINLLMYVGSNSWQSYQIISTALINNNQNFTFSGSNLSINNNECVFDGTNYYVEGNSNSPTKYYIAKFDSNKNFISQILIQTSISSLANSSANYLVFGDVLCGALYGSSTTVNPTPIIVTTPILKP